MVQCRNTRAATPSWTRRIKAFAQDQRGATAIEYALIATLIAVAIIGAVTAMASNLGIMFDSVSSAVT